MARKVKDITSAEVLQVKQAIEQIVKLPVTVEATGAGYIQWLIKVVVNNKEHGQTVREQLAKVEWITINESNTSDMQLNLRLDTINRKEFEAWVDAQTPIVSI